MSEPSLARYRAKCPGQVITPDESGVPTIVPACGHLASYALTTPAVGCTTRTAWLTIRPPPTGTSATAVRKPGGAVVPPAVGRDRDAAAVGGGAAVLGFAAAPQPLSTAAHAAPQPARTALR